MVTHRRHEQNECMQSERAREPIRWNETNAFVGQSIGWQQQQQLWHWTCRNWKAPSSALVLCIECRCTFSVWRQRQQRNVINVNVPGAHKFVGLFGAELKRTKIDVEFFSLFFFFFRNGFVCVRSTVHCVWFCVCMSGPK